MVCDKCERKLSKCATSDPLKNRPRNLKATEKQEVGGNKILGSRAKSRYGCTETVMRRCRICKSSVHQSGSHYCQGCAYKKAICAMCGVAILNTKGYNQRSV